MFICDARTLQILLLFTLFPSSSLALPTNGLPLPTAAPFRFHARLSSNSNSKIPVLPAAVNVPLLPQAAARMPSRQAPLPPRLNIVAEGKPLSPIVEAAAIPDGPIANPDPITKAELILAPSPEVLHPSKPEVGNLIGREVPSSRPPRIIAASPASASAIKSSELKEGDAPQAPAPTIVQGTSNRGDSAHKRNRAEAWAADVIPPETDPFKSSRALFAATRAAKSNVDLLYARLKKTSRSAVNHAAIYAAHFTAKRIYKEHQVSTTAVAHFRARIQNEVLQTRSSESTSALRESNIALARVAATFVLYSSTIPIAAVMQAFARNVEDRDDLDATLSNLPSQKEKVKAIEAEHLALSTLYAKKDFKFSAALNEYRHLEECTELALDKQEECWLARSDAMVTRFMPNFDYMLRKALQNPLLFQNERYTEQERKDSMALKEANEQKFKEAMAMSFE